MQQAVIGIDVGTGSARAGVFDLEGRRLASAVRPIQTWRPEPEWAEQSTSDIWAAVCAAVREAVAAAGGELDVRGIGADATCSLAAVDETGGPVSISPTNDPARDVIVWMDHRAINQAERINATGAGVLRYVGGKISPEMETPKLLWLAENMPGAFARAAHFFDLSDFLTWRMTGDATRSVCTTVSKWTYLGHEERWDESYFREIGLGALADEQFRRIGTRVRPLGEAVGQGLPAAAAAELGLSPGRPVRPAGGGCASAPGAGGQGSRRSAPRSVRSRASTFPASSGPRPTRSRSSLAVSTRPSPMSSTAMPDAVRIGCGSRCSEMAPPIRTGRPTPEVASASMLFR